MANWVTRKLEKLNVFSNSGVCIYVILLLYVEWCSKETPNVPDKKKMAGNSIKI